MKLRARFLDEKKDLRLLWVLLAGLALVALRLALCSAQDMYILAPGAPNANAKVDDQLMYRMAVSIRQGDWLGDYDWLVLSKHSFFALWLAALNLLGVPYLLGGQLLWAGAALAAAWALGPALKKRWLCLGLFAAVLFNPAALANPAPFGFVARVYRDNIFPQLCVLCVAGMLGFALRWRLQKRQSAGWLVLAGLGLAACRLCREDGWWLLPFALAAAGVVLVFILRGGKEGRLQRCALLLVPFVLLAAGEGAWRAANAARYGRFILSDFGEGEFADAYGAMTRIEHENWDPKIDVPPDVRAQLYAALPEFARLEVWLESESFYSQYGGPEYDSGSFYWALREAAALEGIYDTPQAAQQYWQALAREINALCESGELEAGAPRSSVSPPIRAAYIPPVAKEAGRSLVFCATFRQCDPRSMFSPGGNDAGFYAAAIAPMEEFLHDKAQTATQAGSEQPYFTRAERLAFGALDIVRRGYAVLLPLALVAAAVWQVLAGIALVRRLRGRRRDSEATLLWIMQLGLLACILLRAFMIAFVTVSSFHIGTYVMYLASIHSLMLIYGFVGCVMLARMCIAWSAAKRDAKAATGAA